MFHVNRYDPSRDDIKASNNKNKKKRKQKRDTNSNETIHTNSSSANHKKEDEWKINVKRKRNQKDIPNSASTNSYQEDAVCISGNDKDDVAASSKLQKKNELDPKKAKKVDGSNANDDVMKDAISKSSTSTSSSSSSSSVPSETSSSSSSSISSEEEKDENDYIQERTDNNTTHVPHSNRPPKTDKIEPKLKVIAPEQKFLSSINLKNIPDEALDDFDIEEMIPNGDDIDQTMTNSEYELNNMEIEDDLNENKTNGMKTTITQSFPKNKQPQHPHKEMETALQMSKLPIHQAAKIWKLAPFLVHQLERDSYKQFFPIQSLVIPEILISQQKKAAHLRARDVCVSAPTGSGKTLAFVLPILHALSSTTTIPQSFPSSSQNERPSQNQNQNDEDDPIDASQNHHRHIRRLRALVVLPTRDLALQVFHVFERYANAQRHDNDTSEQHGDTHKQEKTNPHRLKIGLAIGQTDFRTEQMNLVLDPKKILRPVDGDGGGGGGGGDNHDSSNTKITTSVEARIGYMLNPWNIFSILAAHTGHGKASLGLPTLTSSTTDRFSTSNDEPKLDEMNVSQNFHLPHTGISAIDILVATPGRLLTHLDKTPGFTLQHLQFLIIDEADRLLNQSYQNWIQKVQAAAHLHSHSYSHSHSNLSQPDQTSNNIHEMNDPKDDDSLSFHIDPFTYRKNESKTCALLQPVNRPVPLRKFLFSATMTKDPQKLSTLGLIHPKYLDAHHLTVTSSSLSSTTTTTIGMTTDVNTTGTLDATVSVGKIKRNNQQQYSLPQGLEEYTVQCTAPQKPLVLLGLLQQELGSNSSIHNNSSSNNNSNNNNHIVVIFTVSLDATHRLTRLLQLLWSSSGYGPTESIAEYSSLLNHKQRSQVIQNCIQGTISIVVCSDGMSRGLDISTIHAVIHYDVPKFAKTYLHRCGRTARAGRNGKAICILKQGQVKDFDRMRRTLIDNGDRVKHVGVRHDQVREALNVYQSCLRRLKDVLDAEKNHRLDTVEPLSDDWLVVNVKPPLSSQNWNTRNDNDLEGDGSVSSSSVPSSSSDGSDESDDNRSQC